MRRLILTSFLLAALVSAGVASLPGASLAEAGDCDDDAEDTFLLDENDPEIGEGKLDIKNVAHDDTEDDITYVLTTEDPFEVSDVASITWAISARSTATPTAEPDFNEPDGTVKVTVEDDELKGEVLDDQEDPLGDATVVLEENELTVTYARDDLESMGVEDVYDYRVTTEEAGEPARFDGAECDHELTAVPTATPTPTPSPTTGTITLDSSTITQGGTLSGSAEDFESESSGTLTVRSDPVVLGTVTADDDGGIRFSFKLPASVGPGAHTAELSGTGENGGVRVASASFTVLAAAQASPTPAPTATATPTALPRSGGGGGGGGGLPDTGGAIQRNVQFALSFLTVGALLMSAAWFRRRRLGLAGVGGPVLWIGAPGLDASASGPSWADHGLSVYAAQIRLRTRAPRDKT